MSTTYPLRLVRGKTCQQVLLYAGATLKYLPITALVSVAPVRLTVPSHGCPDNWPVRIQGVTAPSSLNTAEGLALTATVVDINTLELNALDASSFEAFTVSGHVVFNTPVNMSGWKARMQVRSKLGGDILLSLSSDPLDQAEGEIEIDVVNSAFILKLTAAQTAALTWNSGVYDLEALLPDGSVISVLSPSPVVVGQEVTVWP